MQTLDEAYRSFLITATSEGRLYTLPSEEQGVVKDVFRALFLLEAARAKARAAYDIGVYRGLAPEAAVSAALKVAESDLIQLLGL